MKSGVLCQTVQPRFYTGAPRVEKTAGMSLYMLSPLVYTQLTKLSHTGTRGVTVTTLTVYHGDEELTSEFINSLPKPDDKVHYTIIPWDLLTMHRLNVVSMSS